MTNLDNRRFLFASLSLLAVGCTSADGPQAPTVPSGQLTPHREAAADAVACGDDVAFGADSGPDIRYAYAYAANGQIAHATGVYAAGGSDDEIDYGWDAAGNFTSYVESNGPGQSQATLTAAYDAAANLTDYAWSETTPGYQDAWDYAMSGFVGANQPTREVLTEAGQPAFGYQLAYDATGRLVSAVPDSGPATTYTYDDDALTLTVDTGSGAFHGVIAYDTAGHELSELWDGTDPAAIASSDVYVWSGDDLLSVTYASGTTAAPHTLATVEVDTLRYDCATEPAPRLHGKLVRPHARH